MPLKWNFTEMCEAGFWDGNRSNIYNPTQTENLGYGNYFLKE